MIPNHAISTLLMIPFAYSNNQTFCILMPYSFWFLYTLRCKTTINIACVQHLLLLSTYLRLCYPKQQKNLLLFFLAHLHYCEISFRLGNLFHNHKNNFALQCIPGAHTHLLMMSFQSYWPSNKPWAWTKYLKVIFKHWSCLSLSQHTVSFSSFFYIPPILDFS